MVKLLDRLVSHLPDHTAEFGDQPLVAPGTRTLAGEVPADGGMHVIEGVVRHLPDHTAEFGDQPLVAPGTRTVTGELRNSQEPQVKPESDRGPLELTAGSVAVDAMTDQQMVPPSAEVVAHEEAQQ
jgi:hypothetical protein